MAKKYYPTAKRDPVRSAQDAVTTMGLGGRGLPGGWSPGVTDVGDIPLGHCANDIGGPLGEPWGIFSVTEVAAGALSANTDLAEVFDASQSSQIASDNQVPDFIKTSHIRLYVGIQAVDDGGIEGAGFTGQIFLRETEGSGGGQEKGIYSLADLGGQVGAFGGYGTSTGSGTSNYTLATAVAPWRRVYTPRQTYSLAWRISFADTTVNVLVLAAQLIGRRHKNEPAPWG